MLLHQFGFLAVHSRDQIEAEGYGTYLDQVEDVE
jgi:hypothetical protein